MNKQSNIYDILTSEHNWVKQNFKQIIINRDTELFSQTLTALTKHMDGEEAVFYPRLEANPETKVLALKLYGEHNAGKDVVGRMQAAQADDPPADDKWLAHVEVLYDLLGHHIEEEETQVFPAARKFISDKDAMEIGRAYQTR